MPLSPLTQSTLQSALLGATSNVLAQGITSYGDGTPFEIDWIPVFQFLLFAIINTPPNFLWQEFLESTFPAHPEPKTTRPSKDTKDKDNPKPTPPLSIPNTITKFLLDQTVGATLNTLLFSIFIHSIHAAMSPAPRITNFHKAVDFWLKGRAIDFTRVDFALVWQAALNDFWPIVFAGLKLWPAVSLVNFTLIKTVQGRNLVGSLAGVAWGIYMSMVAAR